MRKPDYDRRVVVTGLGSSARSAMTSRPPGRTSSTGCPAWCRRLASTRRPTTPSSAARSTTSWLGLDGRQGRPTRGNRRWPTPSRPRSRRSPTPGSSDRREPDRGRGRVRVRRRRAVAHDREHQQPPGQGPRSVAPTFIANALTDSASGMIAIETGAIGHNVCIVSACATGTHNIGEGAEAIRRGDCIAVISGSAESPLLEVGHAGFSNMRGMGLPRPGEPGQTVSRPFDLTRNGFVLGEGAASLFLEDLEFAKARGATIYGEIVGYGSAADGWDMVQPIAAGIGSARAMQMALDRRASRPTRSTSSTRTARRPHSATCARPRRSRPSSGSARRRRP